MLRLSEQLGQIGKLFIKVQSLVCFGELNNKTTKAGEKEEFNPQSSNKTFNIYNEICTSNKKDYQHV